VSSTLVEFVEVMEALVSNLATTPIVTLALDTKHVTGVTSIRLASLLNTRPLNVAIPLKISNQLARNNAN